MRNSRRLLRRLVFAPAAVLLLAAPSLAVDPAPLRIAIDAEPTVTDLRRIGVNLGHATSWGAEQLAANVLRNPGFEGNLDRTVVVVERADAGSFSDGAPWLGRPDGFWRAAAYDVRSGALAGRSGRIADSRHAGRDNLPEFVTEGPAQPLQRGDVVALTRIDDSELPAGWWVTDDARSRVGVELTDRRPASPGVRSLALAPKPGAVAEISSYLDAIGERAGPLLPVKGRWRLSFWSRAAAPGATLAVRLRRIGQPAFVDARIEPAAAWQETVLEFEAADTGPPATLELRFAASGDGGRILLDDVDLRRAADLGLAFRPEVAAALEELRPGYLRNWQGQLGETLGNWLAPRFARRPSRWSPGERGAFHFTDSLPDFLDLCREIGANPWLVVPPAFSDAEWDDLGRFLAGRAKVDGFEEIVVEFGNENWNPLFRAGGVPEPRAHGAAAGRAFERLRATAGSATPLELVVNGQHANPAAALSFLKQTSGADLLAVAPYFLYGLAAATPERDWLDALFAPDDRLAALASGTRALGREIAAAEVNLHTTRGDAAASERDAVTAGAASGTALAAHLLRNLAAGMRRQCVYTLAGFDTFTEDGRGFARLWGVVRDLGPTRRLRPTGLAVALLNRAVGGNLHGWQRIEGQRDDSLTLAAFHSARGWSLAAVSTADEPREVMVTFPDRPGPSPPRRLLRLAAPSPTATNEDAENVRIVAERIDVAGNTVRFHLPPRGLAVLLDGPGSVEAQEATGSKGQSPCSIDQGDCPLSRLQRCSTAASSSKSIGLGM